jgi:hypothetical protein
MGHRSKHLRRNWVPGRLKAAKKRALLEADRQAADAKRKAKADGVGQGPPEGQAG